MQNAKIRRQCFNMQFLWAISWIMASVISLSLLPCIIMWIPHIYKVFHFTISEARLLMLLRHLVKVKIGFIRCWHKNTVATCDYKKRVMQKGQRRIWIIGVLMLNGNSHSVECGQKFVSLEFITEWRLYLNVRTSLISQIFL